MPERKGFDLGDYVDVKDRIKLFYELFGQGRLVTGEVRATTEPDGKPRVWVQGLAYRTPDDKLPGIGWSWMELPGTTSYTKGSELENTETSAWGRAIGSLGILIDRSIATQNEVDAKAGEETRPEPAKPAKAPDEGLIGTAEVGTARDSDAELRLSPDGAVLGFRLKGDRGGIKVIAKDALAEAIADHRDAIIGKRVTCYGHVRDEAFTPKGTTKTVVYQVLDLERIEAPGISLPAPVEAPTEPLFPDEFDPALSAEIDRQAAAAS